jgi:hypothetical protein
MNIALETALIAAAVSLSVSLISPVVTYHIWKRQKRREQELAVAERFAAILTGFPENEPDEPIPLSWNFTSLLVLIGTLFENEELREVAIGLARTEPPFTTRHHAREFGRLQALLFEEALDIKEVNA